MDRGKRPAQSLSVTNRKMYMDLKDIIREHALPFLPAKSLFKFQRVCRDWKLQILTPFFAHNQSISFHSILGMYCQRPGGSPILLSVDPASCGVPDPLLRFLPDPVDIRSSSNGLLLCQVRAGDKAYYVCNPATQQFKKLPIPNADHGHDPAVVLIFEPSLLNFEAEYKVVCAFPSADFEDATEFEIYSSKEGVWKISGEICFAARNAMPRSGVYVNGVVYWLGKHGSILAFDVEKDRSQLLHNYSGINGILGVINGKLCSAYISGHTLILSMLVNVHSNTMQMNSSSKMWDEKQRIVLNKEAFCRDLTPQSLIFAGGDVVVIRAGEKFYMYDLNTKEIRQMSGPSNCFDMRCLPYVNSLVSI